MKKIAVLIDHATSHVYNLTRLAELHEGKITLGRKRPIIHWRKNSDICLGNKRLSGEDTKKLGGVSRLHAIITYEGDKFYIEDCSLNGTGINDEDILRENDKRSLNPRDKIYPGPFYGPLSYEIIRLS